MSLLCHKNRSSKLDKSFLVLLKLKRKLFCHTINLVLTKPVRSRWLDFNRVLFFLCVFIDLYFVSVCKNAKKELVQYPALTSRLGNNASIPYFLEQAPGYLSKISAEREVIIKFFLSKKCNFILATSLIDVDVKSIFISFVCVHKWGKTFFLNR